MVDPEASTITHVNYICLFLQRYIYGSEVLESLNSLQVCSFEKRKHCFKNK